MILCLQFRQNVLSMDTVEHRLPAVLTVQVWDNDTLTADDFIGEIYIAYRRYIHTHENKTHIYRYPISSITTCQKNYLKSQELFLCNINEYISMRDLLLILTFRG